MNKPTRSYKKHINLKYVYVNSKEGEKALEDVFDDMLTRVLKKREINKKEANTLTNA